MDLAYILLWLLALVLFIIVLRLALKKKKPMIIRDVADIPDEHRYRAGPTIYPRGDAGFVPSRPLPRRNFSFTPRQLSLVNAKRRAAGRAPMNRKGFAAAVAAAPASYRQSNDDWFTYFLMYEIMFADHSGRSPDTSITVTPDAPFNGQGGTYGGAGASGDWNAPGDPAGGSGAVSDPEAGKYQPGDTVSGYAALDPASAPDPAPSAPSDSSSSYSSSSDSSSSSSSYDSGSSSSSSDSGSSSGGGGGDGS